MKFTQAMEQAFENKGMEFERVSILGKITMSFCDGRIIFKENGSFQKGQYVNKQDIEADWQPVPREVTWQEAIQANVFEGKEIICEHVDQNYKTTFVNPDYISITNIKHGKWYIVEGK